MDLNSTISRKEDKSFLLGLPDLNNSEETSFKSKKTLNLSIIGKRRDYKISKVKCSSAGTKADPFWCKQSYKLTDEYIFENELGVGTYGIVKLARNKKTGQKVAIKISRGSSSMDMLMNEATILKDIDNEAFPKYIDYKTEGFPRRSYLIMEYIEGQTLDKFIRIQGLVTEEIATDIINQIAVAIKYLHAKGIVHRDLKPQNIIIKEGKPKIIDFNISKKSVKLMNKSNTVPGSPKFTGKFFTQISSPLFAAPELTTLNCYTESIDIWGIGIWYATLLLGNSIFTENIKPLMKNKNIFESICGLLYKYSDATKSILELLLEPNPNERPTLEELLELLN